tara:strand:- start:12856 stop:14166 length:1311 start_codon:yes stop_codon:yes gene_type:complete
MKPQLTIQTPLQIPSSEIPSYLNQLWDEESTLNKGSNNFSLIIWQPAWLEQILVNTGKLKGPIVGYYREDVINIAREFILKEGLPLSTFPLSKSLEKLLHKNYDQNHYSEDDLRGQYLHSSIGSLQPRRIITLAPTYENSKKIDSFVSAFCPLIDINKTDVCGDLIGLRGGEEIIQDKGVSLIKNLIIEDLPSWLWWDGSLDDSPEIFNKLIKFNNRIIFDTAFGEPKRSIDTLKKLIKTGKAVNDLNWLRLRSWREKIAIIFDPPHRRKILLEIENIDIDIEGDHPIQAILLSSWMAERLDWNFKQCSRENDSVILLFTSNQNRSIKISINSLQIGSPSIHQGKIVGLRIISNHGSDPKENTCIILASKSFECMRLEAGGMANMQLIEEVVPDHIFTSESEVSILLESSRGETSPLLESSIPIASEIFNKLIANT